MVVRKKPVQLQKSDSLVEVSSFCHWLQWKSCQRQVRQACSLSWDRSKALLGKGTGFQTLEKGQEDSNHMAIREQLLEQALAKMTQDIEVRLSC